ncbi:hypothetical protein TrVE_jg914 [Triparma verrucosa]|uniref:Uncharacterized protein n=1 Tax=Triparma verrucosa TaxID=1606542 RepID=A0A9W7FL11_9STRA|nr:hypothetical protein TrVE_jg914 [Triparma verrucosa]
MGAGASAGGQQYTITDEEMDIILSSARGAVTEATGGRIGSEAADVVFAQIIEKQLKLPPTSLKTMIDSVGKEDGEENAEENGEGEGAGGSEVLPPPSPRASVEEKKVIIEPNRISKEELSIALCNSGLISSSSDAASEQIDSLVLEIEAILGNKPTYVVSEKDGNIDWKALELLGDEKLMDEARETPAVNVAHSNSDHNSKALGMLGTVKAVDSKKVRNRLGSDMSTDQLKRQQLAEAASLHRSRDSNILHDIKNVVGDHMPKIHMPSMHIGGGSPGKTE